MRFVEKITPPDFQAKNFTPLISQNFNSFGDKNTKKEVKMGIVYTTVKTFTLPPEVTNLNSGWGIDNGKHNRLKIA